MTRTEATEEQIKTAHPQAVCDGWRYVEATKMKGLVWQKPVAVKSGGKWYLLER